MFCVNRLIINLSAFIYKLVIEYMGEQHYIENNFFKVPLAE